MKALEVTGLSKRYGIVQALEDVSFAVEPGEILGYLGPNGAGKTSTLRILTGLVIADRGEARLLGRPVRDPASRRAVGYLPGELRLYSEMSGGSLLDYFARFRPSRPPSLRSRLLDALRLEPRDLARRVKFLSHGTRQKLGLVIAMQQDPDLLLLDEPTLGLDPLVQKAFRELVQDRARQGRAILFSSHVLAEVEAVCRRVAVLGAGRLLALEPVETLRRRVVRRARVRFRGTPPPDLAEVAGVERCAFDGGEASLHLRGDVNPLLRRLAACDLEEIVLPEPRLEDIFQGYFGPGGDRA
jgi:ABC-2 type transport system ATP-binding protein